MERITTIQALLLLAAALAVTAVVLVAISNRPFRPTAVPTDSAAARGQANPVVDYVRHASALSDSLFDQTEVLLDWMTAAQDTAGYAERAANHDQAVREAMTRLEIGAGHIAQEDFELVAGLFLEYLDVLDIGAERLSDWPALVRSFRERIRVTRGEIEPAMMAYLGAF